MIPDFGCQVFGLWLYIINTRSYLSKEVVKLFRVSLTKTTKPQQKQDFFNFIQIIEMSLQTSLQKKQSKELFHFISYCSDNIKVTTKTHLYIFLWPSSSSNHVDKDYCTSRNTLNVNNTPLLDRFVSEKN